MAKKRKTLTQQLLDAIAESGLSGYRLAKESGVPQQVLSRFLRGERTLTIETADRLADALGLEFTKKKKGG
jgi:plasmid maintenance system antidote protein VapI